MEYNQRDPVIDAWLGKSRFGKQGPHLQTDQLTGLLLVSTSTEPLECPDEVLTAWYQAIARHRRVVDQSEPAFIEQARKQGWTWQKIAEVLGLPSAEAAEQRRDALAAELSERTRATRHSPGSRTEMPERRPPSKDRGRVMIGCGAVRRLP